MEIEKEDVANQDDIRLIVDSFYKKVQDSQVIAHYFQDLDWEKHLPIMYSFWSKMILQIDGYKGNPFEKHVRLSNLKKEDFDEWVKLFHQTVDERFRGETAEAMKHRADTIAFVFQSKLVKQ